MAFTYPDPSSGFTAVHPSSLAGKIVQFPLVRFIIALVFLYLPYGVQLGLDYIRSGTGSDVGSELYIVISSVLIILALLFSYWAYCRLIERRRAFELSTTGATHEFVSGLALAAGLVGLATALALLFSDSSIVPGVKGWTALITEFIRFSMPALFEEIIFRLILFRLTEEWLGSWPAVIIQAVLFGFAHGGNPGATVWSSVSIVLSAGVLLSAIYMYTRRLWMVWGLHIFWNYFQSTIMGLPVSGKHGEGILSTTLTGPEWITGGEFGIEASALTVLIVLIVGIFFFRIVINNSRVVLPSWKRKPEVSFAAPPLSEIDSSSE